LDKRILCGLSQKIAANTYVGWGADVTYEEWVGVGHGINTPEFPSKKLLSWLENVVSKKQKAD
jgi:hypothetical protein